MTRICIQGRRIAARRSLRPLPILTALAAAGLILPAQAVDFTWYGGNGDWDNAANWLPTVPAGPPGSTDIANINAGTASLSFAAFVAEFNLMGGRLAGPGNLSVSSMTTWAGGQLGGGGGNVLANGGLVISDSATKNLGYVNAPASSGIVNNALGIWSGSGDVNLLGNGLLRNGTSGTFDIQTDADFLSVGSVDGGTLDNQGKLIKSVGAANGKTQITGRLTNSGSIDVQQGTLSATLSGAHTGSFTTAAGAWLEFAAGTNVTHEFNAGSKIGGNVRFIDGNNSAVGASNFNTGSTYNALATEVLTRGLVSFNNAASDAKTSTLAVSGGILRGNGNLAVSGATLFTGGQIGGGGGNVLANGGLTISGPAAKSLGYINAPVLSGIVNNGAGVWSGSGDLVNQSGGLLRNGQNGTFDIRTDADFLLGTLDNRGLMIKSAGVADGTDRTLISGTLLNSGSLLVQQGVLQVTTPFNNQGVLAVTAGARFQTTNTAFNNSSLGTLRGSGTIQTALNQTLTNQGAIHPGESIGRLTIDGSLIATSPASLKIELTNLASFDQLAVTKNVTLGGELAIWNLGYTPVVGDSFVVMTFDQRLGASTFQTLNWYGFDAGTQFVVSYHDHDVTLTVAVPEPHTWLLLLAGIGVLRSLARRRSGC